MAGFGSISLAQTVVGTLIDQRAVVLYQQPEITNKLSWLERNVFGGGFSYNELFSGLLGNSGLISSVANLTGINPYGITYISASVDIESDLCDHPVESGMIITDSSIIRPISARVEVAMPTFFAEKIYNSMYELQQKKASKIILQTKYGVYKNLVLQSFSYTLDNNKVDRTIFTLQLREVMEVQPYGKFEFLASESQNLANASDANTVSNGTQVAG